MSDKSLEVLMGADHFQRFSSYMETGIYVPRERTEADHQNILACLQLVVSGLVGPGSWECRLSNLQIMATGWIFGQRHLFADEQSKTFQKIIALMKVDGKESGTYKQLSETEFGECSDLWLTLLISAAKLAP
jgi:hypothetical protein